jgi:hypothetical protein
MEQGYTFAGSNAYRIKEIISVKALFENLEQEYNKTAIDFLNEQLIARKIAV